MAEQTIFEVFWWWLYANIFVGKVAAAITLIFLFCAIYIFIRWKMFTVSILMLTAAFVIAYSGGFIMVFKGVIQ